MPIQPLFDHLREGAVQIIHLADGKARKVIVIAINIASLPAHGSNDFAGMIVCMGIGLEDLANEDHRRQFLEMRSRLQRCGTGLAAR